MVLIGMRSLRLESDWLTWARAKNNLWFFYTCACALEIERSERKTEGEGEKDRGGGERSSLSAAFLTLHYLIFLSLCDSGLIKRAPSFFLFFSKAKEQPPTAVPVWMRNIVSFVCQYQAVHLWRPSTGGGNEIRILGICCWRSADSLVKK